VDARIGWDTALAAVLLALVLSMAIAWVYSKTYDGVGYLRGFTQTLALAGIVSSVVMLAIGDDIARGLGMVGALSLIRFRATLKDTRDLLFVFASLSIGVACGVMAFTVAVLGTAVFSAAVFYFWWSPFGSRKHFDGMLRFRIPAGGEQEPLVADALRQHCRELSLVNMRDAGGQFRECAYQFKLARPGTEGILVDALGAIDGLSGVTVLRQDTSVEM
jgi:hypothetical protein